jgi:16S rRNA (uracil1498-N3)-methyltransferase
VRVYRLYVDADLQPGATGRLGRDQERQVRTVLRLRSGDPLTLFNGTGDEATAQLADGRQFDVQRVSWPQREPSLRLTVGLAHLRGDRFEIAVQKLTEIGVGRIVPLRAERSVVSFPDARAWQKRRVRLSRIAQEAAEQSERVTLPEIADPVTVTQFLEREQDIAALVERADGMSLAVLPPFESLTLMVGPEGGWSDAETQAIAASADYAVSLGSLILRAETAAIVAAGALIQRSWTRDTQGET